MYTVGVVQTVGATLSLYDHLLTFQEEVQYIWHRRRSGVAIAFVILRYGNLLYCILRIAQTHLSGQEDDSICRVLYTLLVVMQMVTFSGLGLFCSLRVYAVTNKSRAPSALIAGLMTVFIVCQLYANTSNSRIYAQRSPYYGCYSFVGPSALKTNEMIATIGMGFGLVGELLVQLATWRSTFQLVRSLRQLNIDHKLGTLLLRDGTFLYSFLLIWILTSELAFEQDLVSLDSTVLSIAVCRFILRLHQLYTPAETILYNGEPSIIGVNMGLPPQIGAEDGKEDFADSEDGDGEIINEVDRPLDTSLGIP